ncbi:MAG: hypothetical protein MHPSP_002033, partial [Paramarteilia canceri]
MAVLLTFRCGVMNFDSSKNLVEPDKRPGRLWICDDSKGDNDEKSLKIIWRPMDTLAVD